jgi:hypothetical protein
LSCDSFEAVVGPSQLASYPAGAPDPDQGWPFYRLNYVELDVLSTAQAEAIWTEIQAETNILLTALERLSQLKLIQEVWCPTPPDSSESVL